MKDFSLRCLARAVRISRARDALNPGFGYRWWPDLNAWQDTAEDTQRTAPLIMFLVVS